MLMPVCSFSLSLSRALNLSNFIFNSLSTLCCLVLKLVISYSLVQGGFSLQPINPIIHSIIEVS